VIFRVDSRIVDSREAFFRRVLQGLLQAQHVLLSARRRDSGPDQLGRAIHEHSRGAAIGTTDDPTPWRIGRVGVDACLSQSQGIDQSGMTVDAAQIDGMRRDGAGKRRLVGKLLAGPIVLVPAAALDPLTWRSGLRRALHRRDHFLVARRSDEIHLPEPAS